jgi:hypothetical protein
MWILRRLRGATEGIGIMAIVVAFDGLVGAKAPVVEVAAVGTLGVLRVRAAGAAGAASACS